MVRWITDSNQYTKIEEYYLFGIKVSLQLILQGIYINIRANTRVQIMPVATPVSEYFCNRAYLFAFIICAHPQSRIHMHFALFRMTNSDSMFYETRCL